MKTSETKLQTTDEPKRRHFLFTRLLQANKLIFSLAMEPVVLFVTLAQPGNMIFSGLQFGLGKSEDVFDIHESVLPICIFIGVRQPGSLWCQNPEYRVSKLLRAKLFIQLLAWEPLCELISESCCQLWNVLREDPPPCDDMRKRSLLLC